MNRWNSLGLFLKLYVGIRCTVFEMRTYGQGWWPLLVGVFGMLLIAWFTLDVVAYIKRNGGESR